MRESLQARIADPLWLLARQWQLGEFTGQDAGQPVKAAITADCARLNRYRPGNVGDVPTVGVLAACVTLAGKDAQLDDAARRKAQEGYAEEAAGLAGQALGRAENPGALRKALRTEPALAPLRDLEGFRRVIARWWWGGG